MEKDRTLTPWLDTDLTDIEGEEWRDITGYDGLYQVSSYGRIKSLTRYNNGGCIVRERIRRLNFNPKGFATVRLQQDGASNSYSIMLLVGDAFLTKQQPSQIYIHQNKNLLDNRVTNIQVGTWSQSQLLDLKLGKKADRTPILVSFMKQKAAQHIEQFGMVKGGRIIAKTCPICLLTQPLTAYYKNHNKCKPCYLKHKGVKSVGKQTEAKKLGEYGLRKCCKCAQIKTLVEFGVRKQNALGRENKCRACR